LAFHIFAPAVAEKGLSTVLVQLEVSRFRRAEMAFRPLGLDNRAINALVRGGICSLDDLAKLTEARARTLSGLGNKTMSRIRPYLKPEEEEPSALPWEEREITTRFDAQTLADLDSWLDTQVAVSSRSKAVRHLVAQALKAARNRESI
jgi:hypothetical protein